MSHEITATDNLVLRKQAAWHGLGAVIDDDISAVQAAVQFGLTWPVEEWRLTAHDQNSNALEYLAKSLADGDIERARDMLAQYRCDALEVTTHKANVRVERETDIVEILGIVGADYQVCQNRELAEFTDALAQTGQVVIESAGSIRGGKRVWFLARGESFQIGGADEVFPYILVSNAHDGSMRIRVTPTTVRVVCSNTLHMVIPRTEGDTGACDCAAWSITHSGQLANKLDEAKSAIRQYEAIKARNVELFNKLAAVQIDRQTALKVFGDNYASMFAVATDDELKALDKKLRRRAELRRERMDKAAADFLARFDSENQSLGMAPTAWGAVNAMTGYLQHDKAPKGKNDAERVEQRIDSNLFGLRSQQTIEVLNSALSLVA